LPRCWDSEKGFLHVGIPLRCQCRALPTVVIVSDSFIQFERNRRILSQICLQQILLNIENCASNSNETLVTSNLSRPAGAWHLPCSKDRCSSRGRPPVGSD
jgi:hypothetical protein